MHSSQAQSSTVIPSLGSERDLQGNPLHMGPNYWVKENKHVLFNTLCLSNKLNSLLVG